MNDEKTIDALMDDLRSRIVAALGLTALGPEDLDSDGPLFGDGSAFDSIDLLELVVMIERDYGVAMTGPDAVTAFSSLRGLATFVHERQAVGARAEPS